MHLNPGAYAVHVFGGVRRLAFALHLNQSAPSRWAKGRGEGHGCGLIPPAQIRAILEIAKAKSLPITEADLIWGREVPDSDIRTPTPVPLTVIG